MVKDIQKRLKWIGVLTMFTTLSKISIKLLSLFGRTVKTVGREGLCLVRTFLLQIDPFQRDL